MEMSAVSRVMFVKCKKKKKKKKKKIYYYVSWQMEYGT